MKKSAIVSPGLVVGAGLLGLLMALASAVPQADAGVEKTKQDSVEALEWSMDVDCSACHVLEVASFDVQDDEGASSQKDASDKGKPDAEVDNPLSVPRLALVHDGDCRVCHVDVETLQKRHAKNGVTAEKAAKLKRLKKTDVEAEQCLACHGTREAIAEATSGSTVLTDEKGRVENPHALPSVSAHEKTLCGDCHTVHKDSSLEETAQAYCVSCHHGGLYECYTCHG